MILFSSTEGTRLRLGVYFKGRWGANRKHLIEGSIATFEGIIKEKGFGDIIEIIEARITDYEENPL